MRKENGFGENGFSIEIALKPLNYEEGFNFIFALHNGNDRNQLLVGQWRSWIIAMNGDDYDHKRRVKRISVDIASQSSKVRVLTITTGQEGTKAYIDGQLIRTEKERDHNPIGNYSGFKEFHVGGDLLIIYRIEDDILRLTRIGTHSQLFK